MNVIDLTTEAAFITGFCVLHIPFQFKQGTLMEVMEMLMESVVKKVNFSSRRDSNQGLLNPGEILLPIEPLGLWHWSTSLELRFESWLKLVLKKNIFSLQKKMMTLKCSFIHFWLVYPYRFGLIYVQNHSYPSSNDTPGPAVTKATQALLMLVESHPEGLIPMNPVRNLRVTSMDFVEMREEREQFEGTLQHYSCTHCPEFTDHVSKVI